jgi:phosphoserine phosphatase
VILELAADASRVRSAVEAAVKKFAARGFRSLGVARTNEKNEWRFLGVLPLFDPPREDSRATPETASQMGLKVKMVTGDQVAIAREMAHQLGLGQNIVDAAVLAESNHYEADQLAKAIDQADGFAQVFPEHKFRIVSVLQKGKHIVGMTGDGVNDAPALKQADAGIAVSGATDAARAAADIALLNPGLSVIIESIMESGKMFQRMNSYAIYRIAETIQVLLFMTLAILVFNFYPVCCNDRATSNPQRRGDSVHRLRSRSLFKSSRLVEHAGCTWCGKYSGRCRCFRFVWTFLLGRTCFPPQPGNDSVLDVLEALRRGSFDHLRHTKAEAVLGDPSGGDPAQRSFGYASDCHVDCRLWSIHGPDRMEVGALCLGLRARVVSC